MKRLSEDGEVGLSDEGTRLLPQDEAILNQVQHNVGDTRSSFLGTAEFTPTVAPVCESILFF